MELRQQGLRPYLLILETTKQVNLAKRRESYWIHYYQASSIILLNVAENKHFVTSPVTKCTTIFEGAMIDRHLPNMSATGAYDSQGNYWCANCQPRYQMMCNGVLLKYPEIYYFPENPPGEQLLMVHAGAENWRDYAAIRGQDAIQTALGKTWELLRKEGNEESRSDGASALTNCS